MSSEGESGFTFKAKRGWSEKYQQQISLARHGEAASSNKKAADKYADDFVTVLMQKVISPSKCLNVTKLAYLLKKTT